MEKGISGRGGSEEAAKKRSQRNRKQRKPRLASSKEKLQKKIETVGKNSIWKNPEAKANRKDQRPDAACIEP